MTGAFFFTNAFFTHYFHTIAHLYLGVCSIAFCLQRFFEFNFKFLFLLFLPLMVSF